MESDSNTKKASLDDLPKDELIKKCKGLLNILQKAKQSKEALIEENQNLKIKLKNSESDTEMLESLIQQKVQLVTSLEETKSQKKVLENKLKDCEYSLTNATDRIVSLDNENQGCRRQISRLEEENEQLLNRLDRLENETEQLKVIGIKQQQQLLKLEENNASLELTKVSFDHLEKTCQEAQSSNKDFVARNKELLDECKDLNRNIKALEENNEGLTKNINELKTSLDEKTDQNDKLQNVISKLNIEFTEQQSLMEQLKLESDKLSSVSVVDDLQDTNDKLKDKLKSFHSKLVKFANDVKLLRQEKNEVLLIFKNYVGQVKVWEKQLKEFSCKIIDKFNEFESDKSQFALEYDSLKIKFDSMEKENVSLNTHNKELCDRIKGMKSKINNDQHEKLHCDNKVLTERLNSVIKQIEELKLELDMIKQERNILKEQLGNLTDKKLQHTNEMKEQICILQKQNVSVLHNLQEKSQELESQLIENAKLKNAIDNAHQTMDDKFAKLIGENESISEKLGSLQETLFQTENNSAAAQEQLSILKKENNELLVEMNEMNQVLKERGETISKQQEYCEELLKNVKLLETQSKKYLEAANEKDFSIKQLEETIDALKNSALNDAVPVDTKPQDVIVQKEENEEVLLLKNELSILKEKLLHLQDATPLEVSYAESETLSTSTISRADEANRLKDLEGSWEERYGKLRSLALKLKGKIRETSEQVAKEQNEKNELQQKLANSHRIIQTLQSECDLLQDKLDQKKTELSDYLKQLDIAANNKSTHLKNLADNEELISKLKSEVEASNKEKANTDTWKKQVSSKVQNLKRELDANLVIKKELEDQIKKLNIDIEEKNKLWNDEIEKHNTTKNLLLESHNECKKKSVLSLEIQDYERSLKEYTQKVDKKQETITKLKNQVDQLQSSINSLKDQNRLLEDRIQSEEKDSNSTRGELQTYKKRVLDLETIVVDKDDKLLQLTHTLESSRAESEELSTHLSKVVAESQKTCDALKTEKQLLHSQNSSLEMRNREMNDNLRVKNEELEEVHKMYEAYKVRAQSVLRSSQVRDVSLEEKLREEVATFRTQADVLTSEIIELRTQLEKLRDENSKFILEKESSENKLRSCESALEEQKHIYDMLSLKHQKVVTENSETLSSLKVHADTLSQCYRQQLSEQEARHNKEIIELQSKIEKVTPVIDTPTLIPPSTPREQGEGSECVETFSSTKINNLHHPLPLDKLLNSETDQDVGFLRKQITEHETKVHYLTSLLADTEQDLVKHVQMNKLLKEEIRRYQRSVEREKHAENLEYLKNIVYKFATLNSGDERSQLVPVLNTILKFSPDETHQLNLVARGELAGRGWSDYLPIWSSGSKPQ